MPSGWLSRLWSRRSSSAQTNGATENGRAPLPPAELETLLETLLETTRKSARAVMRLDTRLDGLEQRIGALGADVRALGVSAQRSEDGFWSPLMDAIDRLDAARAALDEGQIDGTSAGLASIGARLEQLLASAGYQRHGERGVPVDGRLHRVVGTIALADEPEGSVGRVVRAPVTRAGAVVRTGEVLAVKHPEHDGKHMQ